MAGPPLGFCGNDAHNIELAKDMPKANCYSKIRAKTLMERKVPMSSLTYIRVQRELSIVIAHSSTFYQNPEAIVQYICQHLTKIHSKC